MNDIFILDWKTITASKEIFEDITSESKIIIFNCHIAVDKIEIPKQITDIGFVSCTNNSDLTISSENENTELRFEYGNEFKDVSVSGVYNRVIFNSSPTFGRVPYPEGFNPSRFNVIYFLKDAKSNRLEFFSITANAVKCVGVASVFIIHEANVRDDVTIISSEQISVSVHALDSKELHLVGDFKSVGLGLRCNIGTLHFNAKGNGLRSVDIDLQNSKIYNQLQIASATDNKITQFIIKNASFSSIKSLVFHQSLLSCFVISNCDLTNTEVSFINCKLDDLLTEGVSWPFNIEVSHRNYRKDPSLESEQKQSIYRQLKSISQKNKDVDNFYFFRRKEYDATLSILSSKLTLFLTYFTTIVFDLVGLGKERSLPVIEKMGHENKPSGFISVLSSWIVLKISSLVSVHGTSLFRPIAILICGVPLLLVFFGYYESLSQLLAMSAYVIDPTHKLEVSIMDNKIIINPIHSLFFKIFSSSLLFKIVLVFRKYSLPV
ncbi:hypothetical protein [Aeromonas caviae]|uniref:hypothetical protein n=1 Tax=Aeromonas caviae TaxID=648 RepID=UPI0015DFC847|nr:hypothetical protein [Aeromonas caviae]QLL83979.1 hypothetical protein GWG05_06425 [Aeromonas caviae]